MILERGDSKEKGTKLVGNVNQLEIVLLSENKAFILFFLINTRVTNLRLHALQLIFEGS